MCVIDRYRSFLNKNTDFSEAKIKRICYAVESIINDLTKLILVLIIGYFTGHIRAFVAVLLTYTVLRPFLGGLHRETYWGCFFSTLCLLLLAMVVVLYTSFGGIYTVIYTGFLSSAGIYLGPVGSPKKKQIVLESRNRKKAISVVIHIVILLMYILIRREEIRDGLLAGLWLTHGQIIYLSIKKQKGEKRK